MNRRQWIIITLISLLALLAGVFSSHWISKIGLASDPAIKAFFANPWQTPDGKSIKSEEWQGKVLVVNFWASWCPPCVEAVSYTHIRAHETTLHLVCRLLLEKKIFFNDTATTEIYTRLVVGSVRCV